MASIQFTIFNKLKQEIVRITTPGISQSGVKQSDFIDTTSAGVKKLHCKNPFVRDRGMPMFDLVTYLIGRPVNSTIVELMEFSEFVHKPAVTKGALSQRRTFLKPEIFSYLNRYLIDQVEEEMELERWKGYRIFGVDGTSVTLPDTMQLAKAFPKKNCRDNQGRAFKQNPMVRMMTVADTLNRMTLAADVRNVSEDERTIALPMIETLSKRYSSDLKNIITVFDRGFFSYKMCFRLNAAGVRFVIRMPISNFVQRFIDSNKTEEEVCISGRDTWNTSISKDSGWIAAGRPGIRMRLVRVELSGNEFEILATNISEAELPASDFRELYFLRWPIEVMYDQYKSVLQIESFTGVRPVCILQDIYSTVLVFNIINMVLLSKRKEVDTISQSRDHKYKSNFSATAGVFLALMWEMLEFDNINRYFNLLDFVTSHSLSNVISDRSYPRKRIKRKSGNRRLTYISRKGVL